MTKLLLVLGLSRLRSKRWSQHGRFHVSCGSLRPVRANFDTTFLAFYAYEDAALLSLCLRCRARALRRTPRRHIVASARARQFGHDFPRLLRFRTRATPLTVSSVSRDSSSSGSLCTITLPSSLAHPLFFFEKYMHILLYIFLLSLPARWSGWLLHSTANEISEEFNVNP